MTTPIRAKITHTIAALAVCVPLAVAIAGPAQASAQTPTQLGVFLQGAPGSATTLDNYASMVGRKPDIVMVFRNLEGPLLYSNEITNLRARGETPMVTLEPYAGDGVASFSDIAAGKYDSYFKKEADAVRGLELTVMLRFAHEMNLLSSDWGPGKVGNTAASYVEAWRHIVTIFRQEGANNVKWIWAPNVDYGGRPFAQFFPGDEYVDFVALDGYNHGASSGESWQTFSKVFASSYATITQLSSRPVIIAETASNETGGSKAAWIEEAFLETIPQKMPRVSAVVWFDQNKEFDWRIDSSQASLNAYRKVVASTLYGGSQAPVVKEEAPVVKELQVIPKVSPSPELQPPATPPTEPAQPPAQPTSGGSNRHPHRHRRIELRGRIIYRLSTRATVRITLRHRRGHAEPHVFTAEQNAGHKRVALSNLVGTRHLRRGGYSVSVVAFGSSGNRSRPRHHGFRIVPPTRGRRASAAHSPQVGLANPAR